MTVHVSTFYTPGAYERHAKELVESGKPFDIEVHATCYEHLKGWHEAVCFKPQHILLAYDSLGLGDSGILWVDADARFRQRPAYSLLDGADFAACPFRWSPNHTLELLTGTLWFRKTSKVRDFLVRWCELTEKYRTINRDVPEQLSLKEAWETDQAGQTPLRFKELPVEWVWIEPDFERKFVDKRPVISHLQASRETRSK